MPTMQVYLDGTGIWPDIPQKEATLQFVHLGDDAAPIQIAALPHGMQSGLPSVSIRLDLPDGTIVLAETSLALFLTAADAFKAHYGDPREGRR